MLHLSPVLEIHEPVENEEVSHLVQLGAVQSVVFRQLGRGRDLVEPVVGDALLVDAESGDWDGELFLFDFSSSEHADRVVSRPEDPSVSSATPSRWRVLEP